MYINNVFYGTVAAAISSSLNAYQNCIKSSNETWEQKHLDTLARLCQNHLPHGAGIDSTHPENLRGLDREESTPDKLIINLSYHHMHSESGMYDGWTDHQVIVTPEFDGIKLKITGRDRNEIKDYLHEVYQCSLGEVLTKDQFWAVKETKGTL